MGNQKNRLTHENHEWPSRRQLRLGPGESAGRGEHGEVGLLPQGGLPGSLALCCRLARILPTLESSSSAALRGFSSPYAAPRGRWPRCRQYVVPGDGCRLRARNLPASHAHQVRAADSTYPIAPQSSHIDDRATSSLATAKSSGLHPAYPTHGRRQGSEAA